MTKLLLVRHGLTEWNMTRKFAGHTDIPLSEEGVRQAEKLGARLAGMQIDSVYCSDLQRAVSTAEIITSGHDIEPCLCPELREVNYGVVEGLTYEEINRDQPEVAKSIFNFSLELSFPEGETFRDFIDRTCRFMDRLVGHGPDETVLIVSHGGPMRTLTCFILGISQEHWRKFHFDNASLSIINTYARGPILNLMNDTSHLAEAD